MKIGSVSKLALIAGLVLLPLMISNQSLWIDEADVAYYGRQPTFEAWRYLLTHDLSSDCQMPLTMFGGWVVSHTIGTQEWQLRVINVLWGVLALLGMYQAGKRLQLPWLPLLLAVQPFFWFYMNEARPYAPQLACGAWLLAALADFLVTEGTGVKWAWEFSLAAIVLMLTTMLAPVAIAATFIAGGLVAFQSKWKIRWKSVVAVLIGVGIFALPLAVYYHSTLNRGAKGAQLWHVDLKFFGYVVYELTGMIGLGPSIESMRELARSPHIVSEMLHHGSQFLLPGLLFAALLAVFVFGLPKCSIKSKSPVLRGLLIALGFTVLVFVGVGILIQKAFWARHFSPMVPFYVALLGMALAGLQARAGRPKFLAFAVLFGLLTLSVLSLRFGAAHQKDNYRDAAAIAKKALAENKTVWWMASDLGAQYYHVDYTPDVPVAGKAFSPVGLDASKFTPPDVIIYSKPEIYDAGGTVKNIIQQNGYRQTGVLSSFVIWEK